MSHLRFGTALVALLFGAAPGCGERAPAPAAAPDGGPTWSAARDEAPRDGVLLNLHADVPCRVVLRVVGAPEGTSSEAPRVLAAGESARLWASAHTEAQALAAAPVASADAAAGRTEGWAATLAYGWEDGASAKHTYLLGTRPGRGRALGSWTVAAPPIPATLAYDRDLELACVALADGGGELRLEGREDGSRVRGALDAAAGDRVTVLRFVVRVERMGQ